MSSSKQFDKANQQLDYLLREGIYQDSYQFFTRGPSHGIKRILKRWSDLQIGIQSTTSLLNYTDLKHMKKAKTLPPHNDQLLSTFKRIESTLAHHQIVDHNGNILAYRFRVPMNFINTLSESQSVLPHTKTSATIRGAFNHRHYALWADYSQDIFYSSEYLNDSPHSQQFLDLNKPLIIYLSNTLRLVSPTMYQKFTSIKQYLPANLSPLAGAWSGVAINQELNSDGGSSGTHQDWQDYGAGYNCVVPWGVWTGGDLVLWQCKTVMELVPGDVLFFFGALIAHNVTPITSGTRNSLDLFTHKSNIDWKKRQVLKHGKKHWT